MRTLVIGDLHGSYKGLLQCLERSKFDYEKDRLVCLGDVCDGFPFVKECFDELLKLKHLIYIKGNHDEWAEEWYSYSKQYRMVNHPRTNHNIWYSQGGSQTYQSYLRVSENYESHYSEMDAAHLDLISKARYYYIQDNKLFVHGGINPTKGMAIEKQKTHLMVWDRDLLEGAWEKSQNHPKYKFSDYDEIFVGHTTTQWFVRNKDKSILTASELAKIGTEPLFLCNVIALDTGGGWNGKVTIMDAYSKEYYQSDLAGELYPDQTGRR